MSDNGRRARRNTLAVCIIARDEEELLPACLESLHLDGRPIWDELVVGIDDRTTDNTREIAERFGATILDVHWPDDDMQRDFAAARNFVEAATECDYVYWQDADEKLVYGHQEIIDLVQAGTRNSARPVIVFSRDEYGKKEIAYPRQDMLHKKGTHQWRGKLHEYTDSMPGVTSGLGEIFNGIQVEQMERPGGDRPHGNTFDLLRANFADSPDLPWAERHMFYLAREHAGQPGHEQEGIALVESMLKHSAVTSPLQRSHACIIAAEMCARIGEPQETRNWYLKAIGEWAAWCEPHYAIGVFCYEIAVRQKQEGAPNDVVHALFVEAAGWLLASTVHEPPAYFVDMTIYAWKRYQALSVALGQLGRLAEAHLWMQRAIAGEPASEELKQQLLIIEEAMPDEVQAAVKS